MRHERIYSESNSDSLAYSIDWVAGLFMSPLPHSVVAYYRSAEGIALLDAVAMESGSTQPIEQMKQALTAGDCVSAERYLSLSYTRLFEGVSGPDTVSLYESYYSAGGGGRLFQKCAGDMASLLQRLGASVTEGCGEPPDHLSIELAALATLLRQRAAAEITPLCARLLAWAPLFAVHCARADDGGFYDGAAKLLNALLVCVRVQAQPQAVCPARRQPRTRLLIQ
jgi:TorA specific chaperone